jgi:hypothetical protein
MGRQRHGAEQIIAKLREADVELARGKTAGEVCRKLGVREQTYYRSPQAPMPLPERLEQCALALLDVASNGLRSRVAP